MNSNLIAKELWVKAIQLLRNDDFNKNDHYGNFNSFEFYGYHLLNYKAQWKLIQKFGTSTLSGPFKGLIFPVPDLQENLDALLGKDGGAAFITKYLLGTYESELHPIIESIKHNQYDAVVDIGCSLGYYAAGFGKIFQNAEIHAYDANEEIREKLKELIHLNGISDRTHFGNYWTGEYFEKLKDKKSLVFCDIEGAEIELLDPVKFPELKNIDVIVEMHDIFNPKISSTLIDRFSQTHQITTIPNRTYNFTLPEEANILTDLELSAVLNEMRGGPTPWAFFKSHKNV